MKKILLLFIFSCVSLLFPQQNIRLYLNGDEVTVKWTKESDKTEYYAVERKSSQMDVWQDITRIYAVDKKKFSYLDNDLPAETFFYRIKSVDSLGTEEYSQVLKADLNKPFRFSLNQNYPNPFNPETVIRYSISEAGQVDLRIYNLLGQEIEILVSEYQQPGEYSVGFNASELNSGLYIYKLISGDQVLTRKMTLIK